MLITHQNYNVALFKHRLFDNSAQLSIRFSNTKSYLLQSMGVMLICSILFTLIIILTFAFTIHYLLKQKKLAEMKNDFINNMTHEFKTPISTIALACEALKDEDLKNIADVYNNYIGVINEENGRLKSMAEQILQTAVIDKGQLKLKRTPVDVNELIMNAVGSKKMAAEKKGGTIAEPRCVTYYFGG